ncbi:carboxyl transferase domain-containing protein [Pseudooceanicola sp.]|uniref:acetyl-CoA carboxylase family protein n=1 Tax=Pseudooceanicola sp. TaxID=1914328 RepID=UPI002611A773|nr:carboxyl transferase domain-containing protein [Pseudooceanicola sp.]MDF1857190.1 carboxyl transferase domain-containing protein [Pseudooceanicola sp.]
MKFRRVLVANRGEIAVRVMHTAATLGIETLAVYSADDAEALHVFHADQAIQLPGTGPAGYLDIDAVVAAARAGECDCVHPGYGLLSENPEFVRACAAAGLTFLGPDAAQMEALGDKAAARALAETLDVPVAQGIPAPASVAEIETLMATLAPGTRIAIKAVAGGGGRGIRIVSDPADVSEAVARCASEAAGAFGDDRLYAEEFLTQARHVEVQVAGDGQMVIALGDRDCSLQRRRQKLVEIAPAPNLSDASRAAIWQAAERLCAAIGYRGIATVEFLVRADGSFVFLEVNPRIQVEHTVTEMVTGLDLVALQFDLASGRTLSDFTRPETRGSAVQLRLNAEKTGPDGAPQPASGRLSRFDPPGGPGIRVDSAAYGGYAPNPRFDSLLAKLIVHTPGGLDAALTQVDRALRRFRIAGIDTNRDLLLRLIALPALAAGSADTGLVERLPVETLQAGPDLFPESAAEENTGPRSSAEVPHGCVAVIAPMPGVVIAVSSPGTLMAEGGETLVLEAMKMENVVAAPAPGRFTAAVGQGDAVSEGDVLGWIEPTGETLDVAEAEAEVDPDAIRADLADLHERRALTEDAARPEAVAKRHAKGLRMARENLADLIDAGSFTEYGRYAVAMQRQRRSQDDLVRNTPADGQITGIGTVNGALFPDRARVAVMAYDYTVLAGTQGHRNHMKADRVLELALKNRLPLIQFAEGGGGRPGDTEGNFNTSSSFALISKLSGKAPVIGITAGYCFAGNAAFLGVSDIIIAVKGANIGMGGPAMIEGGGLGVYKPGEIGPDHVQTASGVIDLLVEDEAQAVTEAKRTLAYWQGDLPDFSTPDQRPLRRIVPDNRRRGYDMHELINTLADEGSIQELRPEFGRAMITAFVRIEGKAFGLFANNPKVIGGAIDSDAADKAARFMQLCDSYGIPLVSVIDTPGIMVGPEVEKTALVRHSSRLMIVGANLSVPIFAVTVRKGYGLGKAAMVGGSFNTIDAACAWPTGEFGAMNLEGAVRLAYRKELDAITDPEARQATYDAHLNQLIDEGKAMSQAMDQSLDDVIDPADTRAWLLNCRANAAMRPHQATRNYIDAW